MYGGGNRIYGLHVIHNGLFQCVYTISPMLKKNVFENIPWSEIHFCPISDVSNGVNYDVVIMFY